jgi:hypothetical protein
LEKKSLCVSAEQPKTPGRSAHIEVSGGFPENIGRFREAVKRFCNFFHSNLFGKNYTFLSLLVYRRQRLSINKQLEHFIPKDESP